MAGNSPASAHRRPLRVWVIVAGSIAGGLAAALLSVFTATCGMPVSAEIKSSFADAGVQPTCSYGCPLAFLSQDRLSDLYPPDDSATELHAFVGPRFSGGALSAVPLLLDALVWSLVSCLLLVFLGPFLSRRRLVAMAALAVAIGVVVAAFTVRAPAGPSMRYARIEYIAGWPVAWIRFPLLGISPPAFNPLQMHLGLVEWIINTLIIWVPALWVSSWIPRRALRRRDDARGRKERTTKGGR